LPQLLRKRAFRKFVTLLKPVGLLANLRRLWTFINQGLVAKWALLTRSYADRPELLRGPGTLRRDSPRLSRGGTSASRAAAARSAGGRVERCVGSGCALPGLSGGKQSIGRQCADDRSWIELWITGGLRCLVPGPDLIRPELRSSAQNKHAMAKRRRPWNGGFAALAVH
jgi:hypothetical protein